MSLEFSPLEVLEYRVGMVDRPVLSDDPPHPEVPGEPTLDLSGLTGISLYEPQELVLSAKAATPLAEIEAQVVS